ncbi:hypothetical protein L2E82_29616 [Cichorium intybus]|uniref:Uncharacterized protein n=1 Tax=Cichorium intybus TaxID=13427 RepID=A0ACB9CY38_CICIN|nr:hypothetical protein L2E82_29616 [Cichorium intybus]
MFLVTRCTKKSDKTTQKVVKSKKLEGRLEIQSLYRSFMSCPILERFDVVSGIFNADSIQIYISSEVIAEMMNPEQVDIGCIIWHQMYGL